MRDLYKVQEEAILRQIERLPDEFSLDIIGFLSFVETPFPKDLIIVYISTINKYRKSLMLSPIDVNDETFREKEITLFEKSRINRRIKGFSSLANINDNYLCFPHDMFREQIQVFFLRRDVLYPGSYKKLFDQTTEFLHKKFSGCFWDESTWFNKEDILLGSVERVVNVFMIDRLEFDSSKSMSDSEKEGCKISKVLNDYQLTLWHRLSKYYIKSNPIRAVELFTELHERIVDNDRDKNNLSEYLKGFTNHAAVMHGLAVAHCQIQYEDVDSGVFDLDKAEEFARSAYEIFENKLGKEDPRTLNAYLTLAHIIINLKCNTFIEKSPNNMVRFSGSEPTIDAAIELTNLLPGSKGFNNLRSELSLSERLLSGESYSSIYTGLEEKIGIKSVCSE